MLADYEATGNDTFALRCCFLVNGVLTYHFCPNVNINLTVRDIREDVLNEPNMPDDVLAIDENNWKVFLVEDDRRLELDVDSTEKLTCYRTLGDFSGKAHFQFVSDGPKVEDEGVQQASGPTPMNKMPFHITVEPPNGQNIQFTMDLNISLPGGNIIDYIVQHPSVPSHIQTLTDPWTLVIMRSDGDRYVAGDEVFLNAIGDWSFYSDGVHLKVLMVDRENLHQNGSQNTVTNLGLSVRGNNDH